MKVGAGWECSELATWPNGMKIRYDMKFNVEAGETVETAAGKFDTLRLVAKGFTKNEDTGAVSRQERIVWLSPAAKREVKYEIRTILKNGNIFASRAAS